LVVPSRALCLAAPAVPAVSGRACRSGRTCRAWSSLPCLIEPAVPGRPCRGWWCFPWLGRCRRPATLARREGPSRVRARP